MQDKYNSDRAHDIEAAAQRYWDEHGSFRATAVPDRPKYYCLSMFPYPSGKLHMGHVRNYTIGDVLARYHRMRGCNVLQPMGWDAFGLPAENAAIANKVPPAKWTWDNIAHMKKQLQSLGFAIDWQRELATCDPAYYKWNQWLFLRMLEKGVAYKKTQVVNWDPVDQTVLANEQVIDGRGWRTGAVVEKKEIPGYYLGITQYAEELLADLEKLPGWPERVKTMQANWIGKSYGVRFAFPYTLDGKEEKLWVFTTRADTIMGVTFCAIAAEHPLATYAAGNNPKLAAFIEECKRGSVMEADLATAEKKGMPTGIGVTHPLSGEKIPVWVANYVLMGYGEGAVMAVPAHDERDFHFAKQCGLPIRQVIKSESKSAPAIRQVLREGARAADSEETHRLLKEYGDPHGAGAEKWGPLLKEWTEFDQAKWKSWYADHGICIGSGKYDGLNYTQAVDAIAADLKAKGLGEKKTMWRLRDWGISRQRYWGTPIPIIHCKQCGDVPVPDDQLPVVLPEDCVPDGSGNPLNKRADFLNVDCPKCGAPARRETDTMDTFVDSSWYYARYASQRSDCAMVDGESDYWMPVDQYIGGIEHAILHLLYSRFWTKVMRDLGLLKLDEPFSNLLTQGMVLNHIYFRKNEKGGITYFAPEEIEVAHDAQGRIGKVTAKSDGSAVEYGGVGTMSKSRLNGVDPQSLIDEYGADTARLFVMFASPPEQTLEWSDSGVEGAARFLRRIWSLGQELEKFRKDKGVDTSLTWLWNEADDETMKFRRATHSLLKQANSDMQKLQFNTVVSAAMKMLNALEAFGSHDILYKSGQLGDPKYSFAANRQRAFAREEAFKILLIALSPIAPHITHHLWRELGYGDDILKAPWPEPDPAALDADEIELVVQVNGKLRGKLRVSKDADRAAIEQAALAEPNVHKYIGTQPVKKIVVVPGRLVNVVV
ncbi:MAG TPA: leucine--tRNA ligase [Burkholderiales bacterium]|nr:leucine--tRNA ligase [Burkholderiales bacterium]